MRKGCVFLIGLLLAGCATDAPVAAAPWMGRYGNACVPEAAGMTEGLREVDIEAKVLIFETAGYSHAVAVYLYPGGTNRLWVWDSYWKSTTVRAFWRDAPGIAQAWLQKCGRPERVLNGCFLEDEP